MYDVVIVGAGPAGAVTARYAAQGGASVLLLEKRQEIGSPVRCGEGIARQWIEEVDIKLDRKWVSHEVEGAKVISPNGSSFCINERIAGDEVGTVIERDVFDRYLVEDAVRAGADVMVKTAVTGLIKDGGIKGVIAQTPQGKKEIPAGCVVGADGYESQVGRWAGIDTTLKPKDVTTCLQYRMNNIEPDADYCEFILGSGAPGGYVWVFPKSEESANVGLGMQLTKLKEKGELRRYLDKYIEKDERLKGGKTIEVVAGAVSTCAPIDKTVVDNLMLVGDAARQIDPVTGGGIANACKAAKVAGEVLVEAAEAKDFSEQMLTKYEKGWRAKIEETLYRNWMAKEKLVTLPDSTFDMIIETLGKEDLDHLSVLNILKVIQREHPELVEEFMDLI